MCLPNIDLKASPYELLNRNKPKNVDWKLYLITKKKTGFLSFLRRQIVFTVSPPGIFWDDFLSVTLLFSSMSISSSLLLPAIPIPSWLVKSWEFSLFRTKKVWEGLASCCPHRPLRASWVAALVHRWQPWSKGLPRPRRAQPPGGQPGLSFR